jgi:hypothetical protein
MVIGLADTGLMDTGAGAETGDGLMDMGAGAGLITIIGAGAGSIDTGAGARLFVIITGLAEDAGEASITLGGAGARVSRPTPIKAKFESSRDRGQGFKFVLPGPNP